MSDYFIGQILICSFNFAPKGFALCNGQLLPINQYQALFSLLGTMYGGDGRQTFALPDLRGTVPIHKGTDYAGISYVMGQVGGSSNVTLTTPQLPVHVHMAQARDAAPGVLGGNMGTNAKNLAQGLAVGSSGNQAVNIYGTGPANQLMGPSAIANTGGSQPHANMMPSLAITFCIALQGIFPSQN